MRLIILMMMVLICSAQPLFAELTEEKAAQRVQEWPRLPVSQQSQVLTELVEYYSKRNTDMALELATQALRVLEMHADVALQARVLNAKAYTHLMTGNYRDAVTLLTQVQRLASEHNLREAAARAATIFGYLYVQAGLLEQALVHHQQALAAYESLGDAEKISWSIKNVTDALLYLRQFKPAEQYIERLREHLQRHPHLPDDGVWELNGWAASLRGDHKAAIPYYLQAVMLAEKWDRLISQQVFHTALAIEYLEIDDLTSAEKHLILAERLMQTMGTDSRHINLNRIKALLLAKRGRTAAAMKMLRDLLQYAVNEKQNINAETLHHDLIRVATLQKDWRVVADYQTKLMAWNEEHFIEQSVQRASLLNATFDAERRTREIELLRTQNQVQQLEIDKQRQRLAVLIVFSMLTLLVMTFYYTRRQHRLELQREQMVNNKLRELDQMKDQMLANTSHELRTPLNGIVGLSELLLHEKLELNVRHYIELIAESGRRLSDVVNELLDLAKLKQGEMTVHVMPTQLVSVADKAVQLMHVAAVKKGIHLTLDIPADIPAVMVDANRLQQVFINLIDNAIKFTDRGAVDIRAQRLSTPFVKVLVTDNGPGIPVAMQQKIFEAFQQIDGGYARQQQGTGLGLTIVKHLVELQGGEIGVDSIEQQGSTFWFTLPVAESTYLSLQ